MTNSKKREEDVIDRPPNEDWLDKPNIFGNRERLEELIRNGGNVGKGLAAFGAVAHAFENAERARRQPGVPTFLYPTSRQFPFDEVTYNIICALQAKNFRVPDIKVEMDSYGPSDSYKLVRTIEGTDFRLYFCRVQGRLDSVFNDTAAVNELAIPGKVLEVFEDNSGPGLNLYVGNDWEKDKENFFHGIKVHSKLNGKPRTYLRYSGSWETGRYVGRIDPSGPAPFLISDNDLGREYDPQGNEPKNFKTQEVFAEFTNFFNKKLQDILRA